MQHPMFSVSANSSDNKQLFKSYCKLKQTQLQHKFCKVTFVLWMDHVVHHRFLSHLLNGLLLSAEIHLNTDLKHQPLVEEVGYLTVKEYHSVEILRYKNRSCIQNKNIKTKIVTVTIKRKHSLCKMNNVCCIIR